MAGRTRTGAVGTYRTNGAAVQRDGVRPNLVMNAKLVIVGSYAVLADAHIAQHALIANGIESVLQNEYLQ